MYVRTSNLTETTTIIVRKWLSQSNIGVYLNIIQSLFDFSIEIHPCLLLTSPSSIHKSFLEKDVTQIYFNVLIKLCEFIV